MPKQSLEFVSNLTAADVAGYLEDLARGLRRGQVALESGSDYVDLSVGGDVAVELEARSNPDKGRSSIAIRLDWRKRKRRPEAPQALTIGTPEAPAEGSELAPAEGEPSPEDTLAAKQVQE
jgi:amphi-Trp domain-containing protein